MRIFALQKVNFNKKAIVPQKQPKHMEFLINEIQALEGHSYSLVRISLLNKVKQLTMKSCKTLIKKTKSTPTSIYFAQVCSAGIMILHFKEDFVSKCQEVGGLTREQFVALLSDAMVCYFGAKNTPADANHMVTKTIEINIMTKQHKWRLVKAANTFYLMAAGLVPVMDSNLITSGVYTSDKTI